MRLCRIKSLLRKILCSVGDKESWNLGFRIVLRNSESVEFGSLMSPLSNVSFCRDTVDDRIWKSDSSGSFSSKSFYRRLDPFTELQSFCSSIWMGLAPRRVEAFCWLAVMCKNSTVDILRRGISLVEVSDMCCLCKIDHLLIHCDVASSLWGHFVKVNGMVWRTSSLVDLFEA